MPKIRVSDAEKFATDQATELINLLELQARWNSHCDDPAMSVASFSDLLHRQNLFDAFQAAMIDYTAKYNHDPLSDHAQTDPNRLAHRCRVLCSVFRRAKAEYPEQLMAKIYRIAASTAARYEKEIVDRELGKDLAGAIRELDKIIEWCGALQLKST